MYVDRPRGCGAKFWREFDEPPAQTLNFLDDRLKTANVSRESLPIQLIPNNNEFHGRS